MFQETQHTTPVIQPNKGDGKNELRVYFPVESLTGLGHFNRAGLLVRAMRAAGMEVTVASGTFVDEARFFPDAHRATLPAYVHRTKDGKHTVWDENGQKRTVDNFNMNKWRAERADAHRRIVREFKPNIIVVEFWPFSRRNLTNEVNAIRAQSLANGTRAMWVTSVRDVIKGDVRNLEGKRAENQKNTDKSVLDKLRRIDAIIVHGDERLIKLTNTFGGLKGVAGKTFYSGYVVAPIPQRDAEINDKDRSILFHVGSGSNGADLMISAAKAWQYASPEIKERTWHFVTGPRFPDQGWSELSTILAGYGKPMQIGNETPYVAEAGRERPQFVVERYRSDLVPLMVNSALSVSYAGLQHDTEIMASGAKALLIPKFKIREEEGDIWFDSEQAHRLDELARLKLIHRLKSPACCKPSRSCRRYG